MLGPVRPQLRTCASAQSQVRVTLAPSWVPTEVVAGSFYTSPDRLLLGDRVREAANLAATSALHDLERAAPALAQVLTTRSR